MLAGNVRVSRTGTPSLFPAQRKPQLYAMLDAADNCVKNGRIEGDIAARNFVAGAIWAAGVYPIEEFHK